jgi:hypothetical protein
LTLHPWLAEPFSFTDPLDAQAGTAIQRAADVLGFEYVNGCAYEWTRFSRVDDKMQKARFADAMAREADSLLQARRLEMIAREQARQAELARLRRRNAATSLLLETD